MNVSRLRIPIRKASSRQPGGTLLGLAIEGGRVHGIEVRRTNGSIVPGRSFSAPLALDLLTGEPDLVGREIRKHLDAAGIRERRCVVCVPEGWALTLTVPLPELSETDRADFLQTEVERGFAAGDTLAVAHAISRPAGSEARVLLAGVPRAHVQRLEAVLAAAHLRPLSLSLGSPALQPPDAGAGEALVTLRAGGSGVHLQVTGGGGIAILRTIEGVFEVEGGVAQLQAELLARELRITLGQLPSEIMETLRRLRVFGRDEAAAELVETLRPRLAPQGVEVEAVKHYAPGDLPLEVPAGTPASPALSLVVRHLAGKPAILEFLLPKVSPWQKFTERSASRKLVWAGAAAGVLAGVLALAFVIQQAQLAYWGSQWNTMKTEVTRLEQMQRQVRQFRPWFDDSCRSLGVLRRLTEAFPEDGTVSAKSVEIRDRSGVTCTGTARDNPALLRTVDKLAEAPEVASVKVEHIRGLSPMQFTINFQWVEQATP